MEFKLSTAKDPNRIECDLLVVGQFEGEALKGRAKAVNRALHEGLTKASREEKFKGECGKSVMVNTLERIKARRVLLAGLGKKSDFSEDVLRKVGILTAKRARPVSAERIAFGLELNGKSGEIETLTEGLMLGSYEFDKYKNDKGKKGEGIKQAEIMPNKLKEEEFEKEIEFGKILAESTNFARNLVNEPPVVMTPTRLAETAKEIAEREGLAYEILDEKEIEKRGMGALRAVSLGSEEPPRFIHIWYKPRGNPKKKIAIVGKGLTFDTGGLCIKPRDSMRSMKCDMSGAASVLGAMMAIPKLKPRVEVHGLISTTENMPGGKAYKPDDIIRALNGKTIEVIDTDAEGRIVLADALSYAVELKVEEIIDLATLTGSCIVALGNYTAGVMGNNEKLTEAVIKAARRAGEKMWQLPMDEELRKEIDSDVADVKNVGSRYGGAITAAMFLEKFVGDTRWVHLDIAGPAFLEKGGDWYPKGGTGFGVRTLIRYIVG